MNEEQPVHWIKNIRAVDGKDSEAVSNEIADADIIATALGAAVLEKVAPHCTRTFKALGERIFEYSGYLNL